MRRRDIEPRQFLANLPLFKELGAPAVARIAAQATKVRLARGATLFRHGEIPSGFYVVVFGEIRLLARGARGKRLSAIVGPGRSFGEPVMFLGKPYHVDAVAHDDALLIHVPKDTVLGEIEANPTFARRVIAGLAARIDALVHELGTQAGGTARQRLAAYLLRGAEGVDGETTVTLPATKAAIASQLGLTPEHFSRTLRDLATRGLLRVEGRRIVIGDAGQLAQHAGTSRRKRRGQHA